MDTQQRQPMSEREQLEFIKERTVVHWTSGMSPSRAREKALLDLALELEIRELHQVLAEP